MDQVTAAAAPFDVLGAEYEEAYGHLPEQLAALEWLVARLPRGARVLDIGSGTGRPVSHTLVEAGCEVTGIDVSSTMVELARQQVPGARFELQDVRSLQATDETFDAVCAFFPLLQMPRTDLDATLERIAGWLKPGGYFVMATVPGDMQDYEMVWMGQHVSITSYTAEQYQLRLEKAGLEVVHLETTSFLPASELGELEQHLFCYARRPGGPAAPEHVLAGPYPLPARYRGPHRLSEKGWTGFEERLEREEIQAMADTLEGNTRVLDVGGGTGAGVQAIAAKLGHCTTVEPNASREQTMRDAFPGITVLAGSAEALPLPDASFDAVVATWVLHYTDDPAAAVREMARVLDMSHPAAKVVLVQGTPDNEVVDFLNRTCVPLAGEEIDHQGWLLTTAARELAAAGLEDISFHRVGARLRFDEADPAARAEAAAGVLADFWFTGHAANAQMRQALLPVLTGHLADGNTVGDDAVMLIATPRRPVGPIRR